MKLAKLILAIITLSITGLAQSDLSLRFDKPASRFTESSPLGNGRIGAMIFGDIAEDRIVLNEGTLWSGGPQDSDRPDAAKYLPEIKRLLLEGRNDEAEKIVYDHFTCQGKGSGYANGKDLPYGSYQMLANLRLTFKGGGTAYARVLDLRTAISKLTYVQEGITYTREAFVSAPDQALIIRITASKPGAISFSVTLDRPERALTTVIGNDRLLLTGQLNNGTDGKGMKFASALRLIARSGSVSAHDSRLEVDAANEAIIIVTAATDYMGFAGRRTSDPAGAATRDLQRASGKSFAALESAHIADYQKYFNRVSLSLPAPEPVAQLSTPERLRRLASGKADPSLIPLYFQYGRYLLISSSRPGGVPANLQGIWAEELQAPWNADWHLNVNIQMNYWPAEIANLSELHDPLFSLIESLQMPGARTARLYYGAKGWVAHVITNPWGFTSPGEGASWGSTTTGSAWLCQHLWDHFQYTADLDFLRRAYPILKGSAMFYADMLTEESTHKWLVTAVGNSPENSFRMKNGKVAHVSMGPTIDQQLIRYLFDACIRSSALLKVDPEFRAELTKLKQRLAPTQIGSDGRIMEWLEDYEEPEPTHRHVSHLWGLYPGNEISMDGTPELAAAAAKSLDRRGDISTGWSLAYKLNLWARLRDGNRCLKLLNILLTPVGVERSQRGGSYDNLFDAHPPFQIDGNFGATSGIAEMLVQSREDEIRLLPALPDEWKKGQVTGLRARNGFEVSVSWRDSKPEEIKLKSLLGRPLTLRFANRKLRLTTVKGRLYTISGDRLR